MVMEHSFIAETPGCWRNCWSLTYWHLISLKVPKVENGLDMNIDPVILVINIWANEWQVLACSSFFQGCIQDWTCLCLLELCYGRIWDIQSLPEDIYGNIHKFDEIIRITFCWIVLGDLKNTKFYHYIKGHRGINNNRSFDSKILCSLMKLRFCMWEPSVGNRCWRKKSQVQSAQARPASRV